MSSKIVKINFAVRRRDKTMQCKLFNFGKLKPVTWCHYSVLSMGRINFWIFSPLLNFISQKKKKKKNLNRVVILFSYSLYPAFECMHSCTHMGIGGHFLFTSKYFLHSFFLNIFITLKCLTYNSKWLCFYLVFRIMTTWQGAHFLLQMN